MQFQFSGSMMDDFDIPLLFARSGRFGRSGANMDNNGTDDSAYEIPALLIVAVRL